MNFDPSLKAKDLPEPVLVELWQRTVSAHENLFGWWKSTTSHHLGEEVVNEFVDQVAPRLADGASLREICFDDINMMAGVVAAIPGMLTVAEYDGALFSEPLDASLEPGSLSRTDLALLWNVTALAYMFLTNRWYEAVASKLDEATAQKLEKEIWLERGGSEHDLQIGLDAASASGNNVETLLKGFQLAPGEVGLLDVEFDLKSPDHGWLIHRRCPAWDRFGNGNVARREHSCVICVIGMRVSGEMINQKIRCRAASLPPHREATDYACKWEYWLEK
jgi:hypothetical protein